MKTVSDQVFDELKAEAIKVWNTYDNTHGYADEKIDRIKPIKNVKDNWITLVGMFDIHNQKKLYDNLGPAAQEAMNMYYGEPFLAKYAEYKDLI